MSVKIARLKNGEDVISNIKEVYTKEDNKLAGVQMEDPFSVTIIEDPANMFSEGDAPFKRVSPKLGMYPWAPLSNDRILYIDPTELMCVYEPHPQVVSQYEKLVDAITKGDDADDGGDIDPTLGAPNKITVTEG